jgi:serine/threonine protein kinase/Tfp pilus assembly protein PilF
MNIVGKTIGHILIEEKLGEGGMGEVYAGFDDKLQRKVAVKAIGARLQMDPDAKSRFLREARVLSKLKHPHICQIHDYIEGESSDYLVLEFIDGKDLEYRIKQGIDKQVKLKIAEQIAQVLVAAHEKGVVHRDLKPSNVMVTQKDEVKVLDFGLAGYIRAKHERKEPEADDESEPPKLDAESLRERAGATVTIPPRDDESEPELSLPPVMTFKTKHGTVMGTPRYMSPEQARGEASGAASDMYSFGLLLQHIFTGKAPYDGTVDQTTILDMAMKAETIPVTGVSPDLSSLINRLKSPVPTARPSATEALDKIKRIREKPKRRARNLIIAAVALAFLLLGFKYTLDLRRERKLAFQARDEATNVANFLVDLFEVSDPGEARGNTITAREILDKGAKEIEQSLQAQPLTKASFMETIGAVYRNLGLYDDSEPLVRKALEIRENQLGPEDLQVAQSLMGLALLFEKQGKYPEAEAYSQRSIEIQEKSLKPDHPDIAKSLHLLGRIYYRQIKFDETLKYYTRALEIREKALGPDHPDVAESLNDLGALHYIQSQFDEAEQHYKRALAIRESALGSDHPDVGKTLNSLGGLYLWLRRYDEAEPLYERALAIRQKTLGPDHPEVANSYNNIAILHHYQRNYKEAEKYYRIALEINKKSLREDHPEIAGNLENLAILCHVMGRIDEAEALYSEALPMMEKAFGPDNPELVSVLDSLTLIYLEQGKYPEAKKHAIRALNIMTENFGPGHPRTARSLSNLGYFYFYTGEFKESEKQYKGAIAILEKEVGPYDFEIAENLKHLGELYFETGRYEEAEQHLVRGLEICEKAEIPDLELKTGILSNLGHLYFRGLKRYEEAEPYFKKAMKIIDEDLDIYYSGFEITVKEYADLLRKLGREDEAANLEKRIK